MYTDDDLSIEADYGRCYICGRRHALSDLYVVNVCGELADICDECCAQYDEPEVEDVS